MTLALTLSKGFRSLGIPILSRLARQGGNSGKLVAAQTLLRVVAPLFQGLQTFLLMDSWYTRLEHLQFVHFLKIEEAIPLRPPAKAPRLEGIG